MSLCRHGSWERRDREQRPLIIVPLLVLCKAVLVEEGGSSVSAHVWCLVVLVVLVVTMRQWTHCVPPRRAAAAAARLSSQWAGAAAATNIFTLATRYFCARSYRAVVDRVQLILKFMGTGAETSNLANACR